MDGWVGRLSAAAVEEICVCREKGLVFGVDAHSVEKIRKWDVVLLAQDFMALVLGEQVHENICEGVNTVEGCSKNRRNLMEILNSKNIAVAKP
jgi:hypothetical protein